MSHRNSNCIKLQTFCIWSSLNNNKKKAGKLPSTPAIRKSSLAHLCSPSAVLLSQVVESQCSHECFVVVFLMGCCSPSDFSCLQCLGENPMNGPFFFSTFFSIWKQPLTWVPDWSPGLWDPGLWKDVPIHLVVSPLVNTEHYIKRIQSTAGSGLLVAEVGRWRLAKSPSDGSNLTRKLSFKHQVMLSFGAATPTTRALNN